MVASSSFWRVAAVLEAWVAMRLVYRTGKKNSQACLFLSCRMDEEEVPMRRLLVSVAAAAICGCGGPLSDGGSELGPIVRLSRTPEPSQTFLNTARCVVVAADGTIHVAWLEVLVAAPFPGHAR